MTSISVATLASQPPIARGTASLKTRASTSAIAACSESSRSASICSESGAIDLGGGPGPGHEIFVFVRHRRESIRKWTVPRARW